MELNPLHLPWIWGHLVRAYYDRKRCAEAISATRGIEGPAILQITFLATSHACCKDRAQAEQCVEMGIPQDANLDIRNLLTLQHYVREENVQHIRDGLHKVGFAG